MNKPLAGKKRLCANFLVVSLHITQTSYQERKLALQMEIVSGDESILLPR